MQAPPPAAETIDLGGATAELCFSSTGARPVRPHMIYFNSDHTRAIIAFVASGHVAILDSRSRSPVHCLRTTPGFSGARQAHNAFPTPDDRYIMIANQNGKQVERVRTNYRRNKYVHETDKTLKLYGAECTTPSGDACEGPTVGRPDNAPICVSVPPAKRNRDNRVFVTLRGGACSALPLTQLNRLS